jgi:hypothetical protein
MADKKGEYGSHADFYERVSEPANQRALDVASGLSQAFSKHIEQEAVEVIVFGDLSALELADAIRAHPIILKPLLVASNIAARAIERDLDIKNVDTYLPRITKEQAQVIAGYVKPFLPAALSIPTLVYLDRTAFIDKEIRKGKGQWEKLVGEMINKLSGKQFRKRKFKNGQEVFELDAAFPQQGDILYGIDIKRIEARRDIHKRCDEIVNKATNAKQAFPEMKFGAVIYYPFIDEHVNVLQRLSSSNIDSVVFAAESAVSVENAISLLLGKLEI